MLEGVLPFSGTKIRSDQRDCKFFSGKFFGTPMASDYDYNNSVPIFFENSSYKKLYSLYIERVTIIIILSKWE